MTRDTPLANHHIIFVYGTLKKGEPNHRVLTDTDGEQRYLGKGRTEALFPLVVGTRFNIPFVLNDSGCGHTSLRLILYCIDEYKSRYNTFLNSKQRQIQLDSGVLVSAWIYIVHKWRDGFLTTTSTAIDSYSSRGSHGRPYVDRYVREKLMADEETNLFLEITGEDPRGNGCTVGVGRAHDFQNN